MTWHLRESVVQRPVLEVVKFTWRVEPVGLYESSSALTDRSPCLLVMAAVMRLQAMSANDWYISCAGYVPPRQIQVIVQPLFDHAPQLAEQVQS